MGSTPSCWKIFLLASTVWTGHSFVAPSSRHVPLARPQLNVATTADAMIKNAGDTALSKVQWFGSLVSKNANQDLSDTAAEKQDKSNVDGTGGSVYNKLASTIDADENKERQVWAALANLEKDSKYRTNDIFLSTTERDMSINRVSRSRKSHLRRRDSLSASLSLSLSFSFEKCNSWI